MENFPDDWRRTTPTRHPTDCHTLLCCLFGSNFSRGPPSVFEFVPIMVMGHMPSPPHTDTHCCITHARGDTFLLFLSIMHTALVWLCVKCSKSLSPRPASFVCPQLFRPGARIVLLGSLPEALWPETLSLIGPERHREELFLLCLVCSSIMFSFLLFWQ